MRASIIEIASSPDSWLLTAINNYHKRIPYEVEFKRLQPIKLKLSKDDKQQRESAALLQAASNNHTHIIALDEQGPMYSSSDFSQWLYKKYQHHQHITFLIGGACGHAPSIQQKYPLLSLAKMTLPHSLVKLFLIEQLYRAHTIHIGHPYHK